MRSGRKPRTFFRFITSDIDQISLKIPKKFAREHRKQILLNKVMLIVSDDKVWPVGWMVSGDGNLWLQKGWPEFHHHYCLNFGHLLLFNHLGKSIFHVRIFDPNYREIYNLPAKKYLKSRNEIDQLEIEQDEVMFLEETEEPSTCHEVEGPERGKIGRSRNRGAKSTQLLKPKNPFYSVIVRDSYLRSSVLYAPVRFCRRYLTDDDKCGSCVLRMSNGGDWGPVDCRVYEEYARLCGKNWKKFSDENHLGVGDVCVFELVNEIERVMKVTISRGC